MGLSLFPLAALLAALAAHSCLLPARLLSGMVVALAPPLVLAPVAQRVILCSRQDRPRVMVQAVTLRSLAVLEQLVAL